MTEDIIQQHNDYLTEQTKMIKSRTIPWEGYQKASLISEEELLLLREYTSQTSTNYSQYAQLFLQLLHKLARVDTLQSILVLVDDLIATQGVEVFLTQPEALSPFQKLLQKEDEYIQLKSCKILVSLLVNFKQHIDITDVLRFIVLQLSSSNTQVVDLSIQYLQALVSLSFYRMEIVNFEGLLLALLGILKNSKNHQTQYQIVYILWVLTFEPPIVELLEEKYRVIPTLKQVLSEAIKEKVTRIIISTFRNLVIVKENMISMLGCKLLPLLESLVVRKWADEEILEDIKFLKDELVQHVQELTNWDEFAGEIKSGSLEWTPVHLSEVFWKQNASRLDEQKELVKMLIQILDSKDVISVQVAVHDLGQYVKYSTNGRKYAFLIRIVNEFGGKVRVMELMSHQNDDVRYQALAAVQ